MTPRFSNLIQLPALQVSVIIPVYNAERYVRQACESALAQPETGEVILIEDGSPDNALTVCESLASEDSRVRVLQHPGGRNRGAGASRNLGIQAARYDLIAFLDADDYFLPDRFAAAVRILAADATVDGVYEAIVARFDDAASEQRWRQQKQNDLSTLPEGIDPDKLFEAFTVENCGWFKTDGIVVRRSLFDKTGLFDEQLPLAQDVTMWNKMSAVGRLMPGSLSEPVAVRRVHAHNRSLRPTRACARSIHQMWRSVLIWAMGKPLSVARQSILLERYLESTERYYFSFRFWRVRKLCAFLRLPLVALRYPRAVRLPGFRMYARDAVRQVMGKGVESGDVGRGV